MHPTAVPALKPDFMKAASENVNLKTSLFESLSAALRPDAILATNTSSISITKIAAAAIPKGETASSEKGKASAARVVGRTRFTQIQKHLTQYWRRAPLL